MSLPVFILTHTLFWNSSLQSESFGLISVAGDSLHCVGFLHTEIKQSHELHDAKRLQFRFFNVCLNALDGRLSNKDGASHLSVEDGEDVKWRHHTVNPPYLQVLLPRRVLFHSFTRRKEFLMSKLQSVSWLLRSLVKDCLGGICSTWTYYFKLSFFTPLHLCLASDVKYESFAFQQHEHVKTRWWVDWQKTRVMQEDFTNVLICIFPFIFGDNLNVFFEYFYNFGLLVGRSRSCEGVTLGSGLFLLFSNIFNQQGSSIIQHNQWLLSDK